MKTKFDTVILLPARNEGKAIGKVIDDIRKVGNYTVIATCSGCTDNTVEVAERHGAIVLNAPKGKGAAVQYALNRIYPNKILMMDSDGTYPTGSIRAILAGLDSSDAVIGNRQFNHNNISRLGQWGNRFITYQASMLYRTEINDLCTGMWAFRGSTIQNLNIKSKGFTLEAELFVYLVQNHFRITQIPIEYYPRVGKTKINRLDHLKIMAYLISRRFT
jgi:glycosyltransferase involved in cell wall biosynthesis